jgi:hypothetical protein
MMHYVAIAALCVLVYFLGVGALDRYRTDTYHGPQVAISAPTPSPAGKLAQYGAEAMNSVALAEALHNRDVQLSAAQQTIASAVSAYTGATARMAGALTAGLTQGPPKAQVITIQTKAEPTASFTVPSPSPNDDAIKRDLKEVLAQTTVNAKVDTSVNVSYQDKPFSPFSAAYTSDGASGAAVRLAHTRGLDLNGLALVNKGKPEVGFDVEHIFKGTSAGIGIGATYNSGEHRTGVQATVHIHIGSN